ncbi:MAG: hypothetical protein JW995_12550 [Melioribacteraceae bacterium]|nr:hypothetical protein [Melioribacteraceae bacterium]
MKRKLINLLVLILLPVFGDKINAFTSSDSIYVPDNEMIIVDSIIISGNDITEEFVILRELTFKEGDTIGVRDLKFNEERIYSLGLFNFVDLYTKRENENLNVIIEVDESWYIYPLPYLDLQDSDLNRATYGLSVLYRNFRGRNETIIAVATFGYDKFYLLSYENPLFIEEADINLAASFLYQTPVNKSPTAEIIYGRQFDYKVVNGFLTIGKRLNQFNEFYGSAGYSYVEVPGLFNTGITATGTRIDKSFLAGASYIYDSRDLKQFAQNGVFARIEYLHNGIWNDKIDYNIFIVDFREYRKLTGELRSKWRINYRHTFGRFVPFYDYSFFGYSSYLRGHRNKVREGQSSIIASVEAAYPVVKEWKIKMKLPLLPERLTSARIGIHLHMFYDAGITFNKNESLSLNKFDSGWGAGITFLLLPYNAFRFEYAFNQFGVGEFLIGTGFSF